MNHYQGGVPVIPNNKYSHDFVNLDPGHFSRKNFRWYFIGICLAGGYLFASYTTNSNQRHDAWYSRPDLKPFPAMVPKDELDVTERTMLEAHYQSYRNKAQQDEKKKKSWYRLFFPNDADFTVNQNPYAHTHRDNVYNPANNYYVRAGNTFKNHVNE